MFPVIFVTLRQDILVPIKWSAYWSSPEKRILSSWFSTIKISFYPIIPLQINCLYLSFFTRI